MNQQKIEEMKAAHCLGFHSYYHMLKTKVEGVLIAENCKDLSDLEIERCLGDCVGAISLIPFAKLCRKDLDV